MKSLVLIALLCMLAPASVTLAAPKGKAVAVYTVAPKYGRYFPEGKGWFRLTLDDAGRVLRVAVLKSTGHRELDSSAVAALKQWRFKPVPHNYVILPVAFTHKARGSGMSLDYQ